MGAQNDVTYGRYRVLSHIHTYISHHYNIFRTLCVRKVTTGVCHILGETVKYKN